MMNVTQMSPPDDDNAIMSCHHNINTIASGGRNFCAQLAGDGKTVWSGPDDDNAIMSYHHNINTIASGGRNFCAQLAGDGKTVWSGPLSTASGTWYIVVDPI
jgi:S-adenosylmethionine:diacylglycerol 3-amino-3-carboxypropyl transferase